MNKNDSWIISLIINKPVQEQLRTFYELSNRIKDDSTYWQTLAAIWINCEVCTPNLLIWRQLFRANRRNRHKLMKKKDRKAWRNLPKAIKAFRAVTPGENIEKAISWTISKQIAEKFGKSKNGDIVQKLFKRDQIIAYFNRRSEQEIIVLLGDK